MRCEYVWRIIEPTALNADLLATRFIGSPIGILAALPLLTTEQADQLGTLEVLQNGVWATADMDELDLTFSERQRIRGKRLDVIREGCDLATVGDMPMRFAAEMRNEKATDTGVRLPFSPLITGALASGYCNYADLRDRLMTRDAVYCCMVGLHNSINEWVAQDKAKRKVK